MEPGDTIWLRLILGSTASIIAAAFTVSSLHANSAAKSLQNAFQIDLLAPGAGSIAGVRLPAGDWAAVRGDVVVQEGAAPLQSHNKDQCAVIEEIVQVQRLSITESSNRTRQFVERSWRDVPWAIGAGASQPSAPGSGIALVDPSGRVVAEGNTVAVERDAVRAAYDRDSASVSGLVSGGMVIEPIKSSVMATIAKALMGFVEEDRVRLHNVLPLGVTAMVVGKLDARGGRLFLGAHPSFGFYLLRDGIDAVVAGYRWKAGWTSVLASLFAGLATHQARLFMAEAYPGFSVRRYIALALRSVTGVSVFPGWESVTGDGSASSSSHVHFWEGDTSATTSDSGNASSTPDHNAPALAAAVDPSDQPARTTDEECALCAERRKAAVFVPCGHMCCCMTCAHKLLRLGGSLQHQRRCPVCRADIREVVRVF